MTPTGGLKDEEPDDGDRGGTGVRLLQGEALQRGRAEARLEGRPELESHLSVRHHSSTDAAQEQATRC